MSQFMASRFSPFKHSTFRRYFFVQTISMIGTWSHELARAWLVVEMMGKAAALGLLTLCVALPASLFILHGGVVVDRLDARRVMMLTRSLLAISSLALAAINTMDRIQLWQLIVFALVEGIVTALDSPAEQSLRARLVPRGDFQQAIALTSSNFHLARMLGPLVAGILMAHSGPTLVFLFDGLSYIGLVFILSHLILQPKIQSINPNLSDCSINSFDSIREGFQYIKNHKDLSFRLLQLLITISIVHPIMNVIFRTFIREKFHLSGADFGYVFSLPAFGALAGALTLAFWKPKRPIQNLRMSIPCGIISMISVPFMTTPLRTSLAMTANGFFTYLTLASLTVSIHLDVDEKFRGRIGSLIGLCFVGIGPIMSWPIGMVGDYLGFNQTVVVITSLFAILSSTLAFLHGHLQKELPNTITN